VAKGKSRPKGKLSQLDQSALAACCIQSKPLLLLNSQLRQLTAALWQGCSFSSGWPYVVPRFSLCHRLLMSALGRVADAM
jgi:hypothetical protein